MVVIWRWLSRSDDAAKEDIMDTLAFTVVSSLAALRFITWITTR